MDIENSPYCDRLLKGPASMPDCQDLPVMTLVTADGHPSMTSFWRPSPAELELLNANGHVMLTVYGSGHPPVWVGVCDRADVLNGQEDHTADL
jgi:hypothetical protein